MIKPLLDAAVRFDEKFARAFSRVHSREAILFLFLFYYKLELREVYHFRQIYNNAVHLIPNHL